MANAKALRAFDWIAIAALVASVLFRLTMVFVELDPAPRDAIDVAREVVTAVVILWLLVRTMQATRAPLYQRHSG